jgi:predicted permease
MSTLFAASWPSDVKAAVRSLAKAKGFVLVAILLLTLGIALNVTVFGIANSALFETQPGVRNPESLVLVGRTDNGRGFDNTSWLAYTELRKGAQLFETLAAHDVQPFSLSAGGNTIRVMGAPVSPNYFAALGVKAAAGRLLDPAAGWAPGRDEFVVVSHRFWMNQLGGDLKYVNGAVRLNGRPFTIIGVAEPEFRGHELVRKADVWVALPTAQGGSLNDPIFNDPDFSVTTMVGRLKPGASRRAAEEEAQAIFARLREKHPRQLAGQSVKANPYMPLGDENIADVAAKALATFGVLTGLVLLTVCANLAGLVLARSMARQRETAIRLSLGATRWDVCRQMLAEGLILAFPAALFGLLLSSWLGDVYLQGLQVDAFTVDLNMTPTWRTWAYLSGLMLFAVLSFTAFPAWQASRVGWDTALRSGGASIGSQKTWMRETLVFVQVFVSVILLAAAVLSGKTVLNLARVDTRMKPDHSLTMAVEPGQTGASNDAQQRFSTELRERVAALPGVVEASSMAMPPLTGGGMGLGAVYGGQVEKQKAFGSDANVVGARFFETVGMPILRGRGITAQDTEKAPPVAVLNQSLARRLFGEQEAIGQTLYIDERPRPVAYSVVGIVADGLYRDLNERPRTMFYLAAPQMPMGRIHLAIRTRGNPLEMVEAVRGAVAALNPNLPVFDIKTMETRIEEAALPWRVMSAVAVGSSIVASLIAATGLIGLIAWSVARRTREIGLKLTLGAPNAKILRETLLRGVRVSMIGMACGIAAAVALAGFVEEYLFQVEPRDPALYLAIAAGGALSLLLAAWLPARRAVRISPMEALRHE